MNITIQTPEPFTREYVQVKRNGICLHNGGYKTKTELVYDDFGITSDTVLNLHCVFCDKKDQRDYEQKIEQLDRGFYE